MTLFGGLIDIEDGPESLTPAAAAWRWPAYHVNDPSGVLRGSLGFA